MPTFGHPRGTPRAQRNEPGVRANPARTTAGCEAHPAKPEGGCAPRTNFICVHLCSSVLRARRSALWLQSHTPHGGTHHLLAAPQFGAASPCPGPTLKRVRPPNSARVLPPRTILSVAQRHKLSTSFCKYFLSQTKPALGDQSTAIAGCVPVPAPPPLPRLETLDFQGSVIPGQRRRSGELAFAAIYC